MAKILLFGSTTVCGVPQEVLNWLEQYIAQGQQFIVRDSKGADVAFHKALSSLGARKEQVEIYCMDSAKNNLYDFPVKSFLTVYNEEEKQVTIYEASNKTNEALAIDGVEKEMDIPHNRQWYEFLDRQMIQDCDIAIGLWDGESKGDLRIIQLMNINNKPCYTFTLEV